MKKSLSVLLVILCACVFAFGDAYAAKPPKPPKPDNSTQINGVSRINKSGDIKGSVSLPDDCTADPATFSILVYVAGQSIMARPLLNAESKDYDFILYNVPVPDDGSDVVVTAEVFAVGADQIATTTVEVPLAKHTVVTAPLIEVECPAAPAPAVQ